VDTGADTVYVAKVLVDEIFLPYKRKKKAMSKELTQAAYRSMELLVMSIYKLGHEKIRST